MNEHDRRTTIARSDVLGEKELVVNLETVGSLGHDELWLDVRVSNANMTHTDGPADPTDAQALAAATALVGSRQDESLAPLQRAFAYLPFEHAEGLAMQDEAIRLFTRLVATSPELASMLDYAHRHRLVIERFGRFPHRNTILGRRSTAEELTHIATPGTAF